MRKGENPSRVLARVQEAVTELNDTEMQRPGLRIVCYYDRTQLIETTLHTVTHSVSMGITLVVLVLLFFLGRPSMALLVAMTIPFALVFALVLLYLTNIPIGLLSIGAIDFGIIVDGAVIMAENIARRLGESGRHDARGTLAIIRGAALDMQRPVFISVSLIMVAFLPLLSLTRIEGLLIPADGLDHPICLAGRLDFALVAGAGAGVVSLPPRLPRVENPLLRWFTPVYAWTIRGLASGPLAGATLSIAGLALISSCWFPRLGTEFLPYLDEGVIWVRANFPEGTSLEQTSEYGQRLRRIALDAREFPDVKFAIVQAGRKTTAPIRFRPAGWR